MSFGSAKIKSSKDKSFSIFGTNLLPMNGIVTIASPADFTVSTTNGSGYVSTFTVPYTSGSISDTTMYIRFTPITAAPYMDSILVSGGGALAQKITVTGTGTVLDVIPGIFVSTTGSDTNSGSFDSPFATITKAISVAQAGDTVFVRGGLYMDTAQITLSSNGYRYGEEKLSDGIYE